MLFVEQVHCASLIVDDLPSMDNDTERRGEPTVHCKYGAQRAQLAAYNLSVVAMAHFSEGYYVAKSRYSQKDADYLYKTLHGEISNSLGSTGICGGQLLDLLVCQDDTLRNSNPREGRQLIMQLVRMKTGCLFSLSFLLGWVGRGGSVRALDEIKEAGYCFGTCYQIIDDLQDAESDTKKNGGYNNVCHYYSHNEIIDLYREQMATFTRAATKYKLWNQTIEALYSYFNNTFKRALSSQPQPSY